MKEEKHHNGIPPDKFHSPSPYGSRFRRYCDFIWDKHTDYKTLTSYCDDCLKLIRWPKAAVCFLASTIVLHFALIVVATHALVVDYPFSDLSIIVLVSLILLDRFVQPLFLSQMSWKIVELDGMSQEFVLSQMRKHRRKVVISCIIFGLLLGIATSAIIELMVKFA